MHGYWEWEWNFESDVRLKFLHEQKSVQKTNYFNNSMLRKSYGIKIKYLQGTLLPWTIP